MIDIKYILKTCSTREEISETLLRNYGMFDIADLLADFILRFRDSSITVSQEEYDQISNTILNLFKVRGQRLMGNGDIVEERRGRPKATPAPPKEL